jgi:hypothetical protein
VVYSEHVDLSRSLGLVCRRALLRFVLDLLGLGVAGAAKG